MTEENKTPEPSLPPQKAETPQKKQSLSNGLPRIRTYATDMSRTIKERGETLSSIVTAEKRQPVNQEKIEEKSPRSWRRIAIITSAIAFVFLGVGAIAGVMFLVGGNNNAPQISEGLIFANRTVTAEVGERIAEELSTLRADTNMSLGEIARIALIQNGIEVAPQEAAAQLGLPTALIREVNDIMVGIHAFDRNQPFIILTVNTYDRSFNALLDAERLLGQNLGNFFEPNNAQGVAPNLTFTDAVIQNIDVRKTTDQWPIMYAYPSRTTIIITTNEFTLREVLTRLGNQVR